MYFVVTSRFFNGSSLMTSCICCDVTVSQWILTDDVMYFVLTSLFSTDDVLNFVVTSSFPNDDVMHFVVTSRFSTADIMYFIVASRFSH